MDGGGARAKEEIARRGVGGGFGGHLHRQLFSGEMLPGLVEEVAAIKSCSAARGGLGREDKGETRKMGEENRTREVVAPGSLRVSSELVAAFARGTRPAEDSAGAPSPNVSLPISC